MKKYLKKIIPHIGIEKSITPFHHFFRDLLFTFLLWQIGFRDFQAVFATMLISGAYESGQGISYRGDGSHNFFDFIDFFPSLVAGFIVVSFLSKNSDLFLLIKLIMIYLGFIFILILLNKLVGYKFIYKT